MRAFVPVALAAAVLAAGCGGAAGESGGGAGQEPKLETSDAGTRIITAIDERAGLRIEVQDDSLYVKAEAGVPQSTRELEGELLGASCEDDGKAGVEASAQFPVYWREDSGDWGSAVAREDNQGRVESYDSFEAYEETEETRPVLAEHVTRCRLFATEPAGGADQVVFDTNDEPVATATFR
jgi:hypothetical protein